MHPSKGRLAFVGIGLHDEKGITLRGLEELKRADLVFAEEYTSTLSEGSLDRLAAMAGKEIKVLSRAEVEEGTEILRAAREKPVALLVAGDPMSATTHVDLRLRALMESVETELVSGVSIMTAIPGLLGLQHYKFGRTTTLPFPQEGYSPTSPYEVIGENLARGLHTMVLLDIDADNRRYMTANEGIHLLLDLERRMGKGAVMPHTALCVVARAGSPDCIVRSGIASELVDDDFGPPLHSIVVPGRLHFMEEEALRILGGAGAGR